VNALSSSGSFVFAGIYNSLYRSTNNGLNWSQTTLNFQDVTCIATNGANIFAGTNSEGVYVSTNNGLNWSQTFLDNVTIYSIAASGTNIFASTDNYIYLSTNNGVYWNQTNLFNQQTSSLAINNPYVFAGAYYDIFLTTNYGLNWNSTQLNQGPVVSLAVSGSNVYAGILTNVFYVSTNEGTNWVQSPLYIFIESIAISGINIFAGSDGQGVYRSTNNALSWTQRNEGLGNENEITALTVTSNYLIAGVWANLTGIWRRPLSDFLGISQVGTSIPKSFQLYQNYPNPFNPTTSIKYSIPKDGEVTLKVYNLLGQVVETLASGFIKAGEYEANFNGENHASGVYIYRLEFRETGSSEILNVSSKKMVLLK